MRGPAHEGFTLVELLIVVVIIGILASIAIPKFSTTRERAYIAAVTADLKVLASQMESYQSDNLTYPPDVTNMQDMVLTDGVTVTINQVDFGRGWAATGFHTAIDGRTCGIYYGSGSAGQATPATQPGVVTCQN